MSDKARRLGIAMAWPITIPIFAGFIFLGMAFGLYATGLGLPWFLPILMSAFIFAGSMEFLAATLLVAPFDPLGALLLTLVVNARHFFYGLSLLEAYRGTGWKKFFLIFGLCDETFAVNVTANVPEEADKGWFYLTVTTLNYWYWVGGVAIGSIASGFITISLKGIEFTLVALFAVLFLETLLTAKQKHFGVSGVGVSAVMLLIFGPKLFMIPAIIGVLVVCIALRKTEYLDIHEDIHGDTAIVAGDAGESCEINTCQDNVADEAVKKSVSRKNKDDGEVA